MLMPARRLESAARLYRKGRTQVLWMNGVLVAGGSLFLFLNVLDYFLDEGAPFRVVDLGRIFGYLALSVAAGYLYGRFTWRNLACAFAPEAGVSPEPRKPVQ